MHYIVKPGYCPAKDCTVRHVVKPVEYWTGHQQYQGTHHGGSYVYEPWMVTDEDAALQIAHKELAAAFIALESAASTLRNLGWTTTADDLHTLASSATGAQDALERYSLGLGVNL